MKQNLVELNEIQGVVIDEDGSFDVVSKESSEFSFSDVLNKENELEDLNNKIEIIKNKINHNKKKIKFNKSANMILILFGLIVLLCHDVFNIKFINLLIGLTIFLSYLKLMIFMLLGSNKKLNKRLKELELELNKDEERKLELSKEIEHMKSIINYKVQHKEENEEIIKSIVNSTDYEEVFREEDSKVITGPVRVIKLKR